MKLFQRTTPVNCSSPQAGKIIALIQSPGKHKFSPTTQIPRLLPQISADCLRIPSTYPGFPEKAASLQREAESLVRQKKPETTSSVSHVSRVKCWEFVVEQSMIAARRTRALLAKPLFDTLKSNAATIIAINRKPQLVYTNNNNNNNNETLGHYTAFRFGLNTRQLCFR